MLSVDELRYPVLASEQSVFKFALAAYGDDEDFNINEGAAEKLAGNHGFLKGFATKVKNMITGGHPDGMSTARKIALGSSILFVATALRLACTDPKRFGRIGGDTAKLFGQWVVEAGRFVLAVMKGTGGWLLRRFKSLLQYLKSLRGPLGRAAARGSYRAGQGFQRAVQRART